MNSPPSSLPPATVVEAEAEEAPDAADLADLRESRCRKDDLNPKMDMVRPEQLLKILRPGLPNKASIYLVFAAAPLFLAAAETCFCPPCLDPRAPPPLAAADFFPAAGF